MWGRKTGTQRPPAAHCRGHERRHELPLPTRALVVEAVRAGLLHCQALFQRRHLSKSSPRNSKVPRKVRITAIIFLKYYLTVCLEDVQLQGRGAKSGPQRRQTFDHMTSYKGFSFLQDCHIFRLKKQNKCLNFFLKKYFFRLYLKDLFHPKSNTQILVHYCLNIN